MKNDHISLVIFTCEEREHLLLKTLKSFRENCEYEWGKIILAIDGKIDLTILKEIVPDIILQQPRGGYVNSIATVLPLIKTPYFFWLEDDWKFNSKINLDFLFDQLKKNQEWCEIYLSKNGPLTAEEKINPLGQNLYYSTYGFSANPCLCNTKLLQKGFSALELAPKGDKLGQDGFENFLSRRFASENIKTVVLDPVDHLPISHEGYLETTPRKWHMTSSLEGKSNKEHLMTIPVPVFWRRMIMILKLTATFLKLIIVQLYNNRIYEYCFRIVTSSQSTLKNKD